jgi:hypothetical protein
MTRPLIFNSLGAHTEPWHAAVLKKNLPHAKIRSQWGKRS